MENIFGQELVKQGQIAGVGIAHRGDTEYLKSIPNGSENDSLSNLPSVSSEPEAYAVLFKAASFFTKPAALAFSKNRFFVYRGTLSALFDQL